VAIFFFFTTSYLTCFQFSKGKDKNTPGGFLLSKSSSGQATLLDFALFDHISRLEALSLISMHSIVVNTFIPGKGQRNLQVLEGIDEAVPNKGLDKGSN